MQAARSTLLPGCQWDRHKKENPILSVGPQTPSQALQELVEQRPPQPGNRASPPNGHLNEKRGFTSENQDPHKKLTVTPIYKFHGGSSPLKSGLSAHALSDTRIGLENTSYIVEAITGSGEKAQKHINKHKCYQNAVLMALALAPKIHEIKPLRPVFEVTHNFINCMQDLKTMLETTTETRQGVELVKRSKKNAENNRDLIAAHIRRNAQLGGVFDEGLHASADEWMEELLNMIKEYRSLFEWRAHSEITCKTCGTVKSINTEPFLIAECEEEDLSDLFITKTTEPSDFKAVCERCNKTAFVKKDTRDPTSLPRMLIITRCRPVGEARVQQQAQNEVIEDESDWALTPIQKLPETITLPGSQTSFALETSLLHRGTLQTVQELREGKVTEGSNVGHWIAYNYPRSQVFDDDDTKNTSRCTIQDLLNDDFVEVIGIYSRVDAIEYTKRGTHRPESAKQGHQTDTRLATQHTHVPVAELEHVKDVTKPQPTQSTYAQIVHLQQAMSREKSKEDILSERIAQMTQCNPAEVARVIEQYYSERSEDHQLTDADRSWGISIGMSEVKKIWPPLDKKDNDVEYNLTLVKKAFPSAIDVHKGTYHSADELRLHFGSLKDCHDAYETCVNMMAAKEWTADMDLHYLRLPWKAGGLKANEIPGRLHFGPINAKDEGEATKQVLEFVSMCLKTDMQTNGQPLQAYIETPLVARKQNKSENSYTVFAVCRNVQIAQLVVSEFDRLHKNLPVQVSGNGPLEQCYLCRERGHSQKQCKRLFIIRISRKDCIPVKLRLELKNITGAFRSTTGNQQEHGPPRSWALLFYKTQSEQITAAATIIKDKRVRMMICTSMPSCCEDCGECVKNEDDGTFKPAHERGSQFCPAKKRWSERPSERFDRNMISVAKRRTLTSPEVVERNNHTNPDGSDLKMTESADHANAFPPLGAATPSKPGGPKSNYKPEKHKSKFRKQTVAPMYKSILKPRHNKHHQKQTASASGQTTHTPTTTGPHLVDASVQPTRTLSSELSKELKALEIGKHEHTYVQPDRLKNSGEEKELDSKHQQHHHLQQQQQQPHTLENPQTTPTTIIRAATQVHIPTRNSFDMLDEHQTLSSPPDQQNIAAQMPSTSGLVKHD
jgi:hypothetical protein